MAGVPGGPRPHVVKYRSEAIAPGADGTFHASVQIPRDGNYTAFFVSVHFYGGHHTTTSISTNKTKLHLLSNLCFAGRPK